MTTRDKSSSSSSSSKDLGSGVTRAGGRPPEELIEHALNCAEMTRKEADEAGLTALDWAVFVMDLEQRLAEGDATRHALQQELERARKALAPFYHEHSPDVDDAAVGYLAECVAKRLSTFDADVDRWNEANQRMEEDRDKAIGETRTALQHLDRAEADLAASRRLLWPTIRDNGRPNTWHEFKEDPETQCCVICGWAKEELRALRGENATLRADLARLRQELDAARTLNKAYRDYGARDGIDAETALAALRTACAALPRYNILMDLRSVTLTQTNDGEWIKAADLDALLRKTGEKSLLDPTQRSAAEADQMRKAGID